MAKSGTKMTRMEVLRSPKGVVGFNYLTNPDEKYGAKHRIQLFITDPKDPAFKAFAAKLSELQTTYFKSIKHAAASKDVPGLKKADAYLAEKFGQHGVKEGTYYFEFTSNARKDDETGEWRVIPVVDAKGQPTSDIRVFSGDIVKVSVTVMGYNTGKEKGIKAYLNAVQMLVKKSGGGSPTSVFEDESSEYGTEEATEEAPFEDESGTTPEEETPAPKGKGAKGKAAKTTKAAPSSAPAEEGGVDLADLV